MRCRGKKEDKGAMQSYKSGCLLSNTSMAFPCNSSHCNAEQTCRKQDTRQAVLQTVLSKGTAVDMLYRIW